MQKFSRKEKTGSSPLPYGRGLRTCKNKMKNRKDKYIWHKCPLGRQTFVFVVDKKHK